MQDLLSKIENIVSTNPFKIVISGAKNKDSKFTKVTLQLNGDSYQAEKQIGTQVFHENLTESSLPNYCITSLENDFNQLNAFDGNNEYSIKITKKGKLLYLVSKNSQARADKNAPNRKKNYILKEGEFIEPLYDMGIFTKDGKVVASMYDKFKQINRYIEIIDDTIKDREIKKLTVVDFGCGKSYLTFLLYYYFTEIKKIDVKMIGLDLKEEVIKNCNITAEKYKYNNLKFQLGDIANFNPDFKIDMVVTLHACDTATDYALYNAVNWESDMIFSVPCCQKEVNGQIKNSETSLLTRYGIIKDRLSSLMTDSIRANLLGYCGYQTQLLEFVDFENTPKNTLIRGIKAKVSEPKRKQLLKEVVDISEQFKIKQTLFELLKKSDKIKL